MILTALANLLYTILNTIWVVELPSFPDVVSNAFQQAITYITWGFGFLRGLLGATTWDTIWVFLKLTIAAHVIYLGYDVVMWVLRKIPMLSISK